MMCQRIGLPPMSTIGFGRNSVSSRIRVPCPPQRMTTFTRPVSAPAGYHLRMVRMRIKDGAGGADEGSDGERLLDRPAGARDRRDGPPRLLALARAAASRRPRDR